MNIIEFRSSLREYRSRLARVYCDIFIDFNLFNIRRKKFIDESYAKFMNDKILILNINISKKIGLHFKDKVRKSLS